MQNTLHGIRTLGIFLDLPVYLEMLLNDVPIMRIGDTIEFDLIVPKLLTKNRVLPIRGDYIISDIKLKYGGKYHGLTQYLSFKGVL